MNEIYEKNKIDQNFKQKELQTKRKLRLPKTLNDFHADENFSLNSNNYTSSYNTNSTPSYNQEYSTYTYMCDLGIL